MPEMDGKKCLGEILGVNPKARVVIASGYSEVDRVVAPRWARLRDTSRNRIT